MTSHTLEDVLRVGDANRLRTADDVIRVERIARERPADLTDDQIKLLSE